MYPTLERFVNDQKWLDSIAQPLQGYVSGIFGKAGGMGKPIKNALNGTWLGHPLHPVITDVPVGAWTTTMILDGAGAASGNEGMQRAADIALGTGLAAALGAAVTGWTDWSDTYGSERKVGLAHGLMMVSTTAAYALSLLLRLSGSRKSGVFFSTVGVGLMSMGSYLGGDEVFEIGYGVNHTAFEHGPTKYRQVMRESDLPADKPTKVEAGGVSIVLVKQGAEIYALSDTCVHAGCSLAGGELRHGSIVCPCHGSEYRLIDGGVLNGPATTAEPYYDVQVENGMIEVKLGGD